jgi:hypothetical protein
MQDHAIVIKADAKAFGAVTALSVGRYSDRWKGSDKDKRIFDGKPFNGTSECISYFAEDKSDARIFRATRSTSVRKPNRRRVIIAQHNDIALMAKMGTIHASNDI